MNVRGRRPADVTEERFRKDVAEHRATILRDDGLNRHIQFRRPGTYCMGFDLITWPGYLCYTGDMGTYVFSRLADMFEFFRSTYRNEQKQGLYINPQYWAEKCRAADHYDGITEYNEDVFRERVNEWITDAEESDLTFWICNCGYVSHTQPEHRTERYSMCPLQAVETPARDSGLRAAVEEQLFDLEFDGEHEARRAAFLFNYGGYSLRDFSEVNLHEYTHRFMWCCYAIAWGIQQYDALKQNQEVFCI